MKKVKISFEKYTKNLNDYILYFNLESRKELMKNITILSNNLLPQLPFKFKEIRILIKFAYEKNIEYLNSQLIELDYDRNSIACAEKN